MCKSTTLSRWPGWLCLGTGLLCALLAACGECAEGGPCDAEDVSYSYPSSRQACSTLSESDCERASHCIMDSVCASAASCSGAGCSEVCDLVRVCVPY
jgi:hypothetical protein